MKLLRERLEATGPDTDEWKLQELLETTGRAFRGERWPSQDGMGGKGGKKKISKPTHFRPTQKKAAQTKPTLKGDVR